MQKTLRDLRTGAYQDSTDSEDVNNSQSSETPSYFSDSEEEESYRREKDKKRQQRAAAKIKQGADSVNVSIKKGSLEQ